MASLDDFEEEYFVFGVNSPHAVMVYGERSKDNSCVLFQKRNNLLVPVGEDSIRWMNISTDMPPQREDAVKVLKRKKVTQVFTTDTHLYKEGLWGLINVYAPEDWDYEEDRYPPAEVYFAICKESGDYLDCPEDTIEVKYVEIIPD